MKKKVISLLLTLLLIAVLSVSAMAAEGPRCWDDAALLSDWEDSELNSMLDEISQRQNFDVVVITVDTLGGIDIDEAADYVYDAYGYGMGENADGALLLLAMQEREWTIRTCGRGETVLDDETIDAIADAMMSDLQIGDYASAFAVFARECDARLSQPGDEFFVIDDGTDWQDDYDDTEYELVEPKKSFNVGGSLLTSGGVSMAAAGAVTSGMKRKLKSVKKQTAAANYVTPGSLHLTDTSDRFLYHHLTFIPRADSNNNKNTSNTSHHISSSPLHGFSSSHSSFSHSHGGHGGKF